MKQEQRVAMPRLSYPTRWISAPKGKVEEYIIPDADKPAVLDLLYIFDPVPEMSDTMFDLHEEKTFRVGDFRVVRFSGIDMLASPYFPRSGGIVTDWMPPDIRPGETITRKIRGCERVIITCYLGPRGRFH
jgi:hypothetical protein